MNEKNYCKNIIKEYKNTNIEYLQRLVKICDQCLEKDDYQDLFWNSQRKKLVRNYSWAIPCETAIDYLASYNQIIEIGAGKGYWASLINKSGGNCKAYDKKEINGYTNVKKYQETLGADNLMLCWPPSNSEMARKITQKEKPETLIFIGQRTKVTGNKSFHNLLDTFKQEKKIEIPSWPRVTDNLYVFKTTYS